MSLIFCDGFDHYAGLYPSNPTSSFNAKGWVCGNIAPFQNGRINGSGGSLFLYAANTNSATRYCDQSQQSPWVTVGTAFWHGGNYIGSNQQKYGQIELSNSTTSTNFLYVRFDSNGNIYLYNGSNTLLTALYGVYAATLANWNYIEIQSLIANTGYVSIAINGNNIIYYSGQTNNGSTNNNVNQLTISDYSNGFNRGLNFDDLYWNSNTGNYCTGFLGDIRIIPTYPTGVGLTAQLSGSPGNPSGTNWNNVNNYSGATGTYNYGYTGGLEDTYVFSGLNYLNPSYPNVFAKIYGVQVNVLAMKSDAGNRSIVHLALKSGIYTTGINTYLTNTPVYVSAPFSADFATSGQLTESGVSGTYFGVRIIQ